jgi:hypothetical protein
MCNNVNHPKALNCAKMALIPLLIFSIPGVLNVFSFASLDWAPYAPTFGFLAAVLGIIGPSLLMCCTPGTAIDGPGQKNVVMCRVKTARILVAIAGLFALLAVISYGVVVGVIQDCANSDAPSEWFDAPCTDEGGYVCRFDESFEVSSGTGSDGPFVFFSADDYPYGKTFSDARAYCNSLGGDLASIHSEAENEMVAELIGANEGGGGGGFGRGGGGEEEEGGLTWIGFTDSAVEGSWVWTDGTPVEYENWCAITGEPNSDAGEEDCTAFLPAIGQGITNFCAIVGPVTAAVFMVPPLLFFLLAIVALFFVHKGAQAVAKIDLDAVGTQMTPTAVASATAVATPAGVPIGTPTAVATATVVATPTAVAVAVPEA